MNANCPIKVFLVLLLSITFFYGCRKSLNENDLRQEKFFQQTGIIPNQLIPVLTDLKLKSTKKDFVPQLVTKAGYPKWHYTKVDIKKSKFARRNSSENENNDTIYTYTPFVSEEYHNVQAILISRQIQDEITYKFILADYYRDFPRFSANDRLSATATDVANLFFAFEFDVFGHTAIKIKDRSLLFPLSFEQQEAGLFVNSVYLSKAGDIRIFITSFSVQVCTEIWYDPDYYQDPNHDNGNETFDHYDCDVIFFGGGGSASGGGTGNGGTGNGGTGNGGGNDPGNGGGGGNVVGGGFDYPGGPGFTEYPELDIHNYHNQAPLSTLNGWEPLFDLEKEDYSPQTSGPYICTSSFNFQSQGTNSNTNIAKTWGIYGEYSVGGQTFSITFGVTTYAPKDIVYNVQEIWSRLYVNFYSELVLPGHVWTETDAQGVVHLKYDAYAQALLASNACNFASTNKNNPQSVLMHPNGSGLYKQRFKEFYTNYMKYYMPGTTATILNVNESGTASASFSPTPC